MSSGTQAKPFHCKECFAPITKHRVLTHRLCARCYAVRQMKELKHTDPERFKVYQERGAENYKKKVRLLGLTKIGNMKTVAVCNECKGFIKGRFSGIGWRKHTNRGIKCPHCGYYHSAGEEIRLIRVKRLADEGVNILTLNNWEMYKNIPGVKEFIDSLPSKLRTTEDLRESMKLEPLKSKDYRSFDRKRKRLMQAKRKATLRKKERERYLEVDETWLRQE